MKNNLPVIVLQEIVLLPNNDIRLEFEDIDSKKFIDVSESFYENNILIISQNTKKDQINEMPLLGIIAKITHKIELPNGKIRIVLTGLNRANVHEYINESFESNYLEAIITEVNKIKISEKEEEAYTRKLYHEMQVYIKNLPYVSNSILSVISNMNNLDQMTDVVAQNLPLAIERQTDYLYEVDAINRLKMILNDIYNEQEMFQIEKELDSKIKKDMDIHQREYLLREKIRFIKEELGELSIKDEEIENIKNKIENLKAPEKIKERLYIELNKYETLTQNSPEISIVYTYIEWLLDLPWNSYTIDNDDLEDVKRSLDNSHNGLEKVKMRIIEYLAVKQMTNNLRSPIICLVGPPGVGKTSLAFSIANAMKRNFVKISVGGINDEAEIIGHRRTYLGASPGRIIQSLKRAKSSNPVFLIDEIDKMTYSYKGDPASTLLEILDPEQNKYFKDNYIEEEYDLSKIMFIATANNIEDIPDALKDRLEIVNLSGYTELEKLDISKNYLLPKICKEHGVNPTGIEIKDEILLKIIRNYTKEAGVRELERQISTIIRKIVTTIVKKRIMVNKYIIDNKKLEEYLGSKKYNFNNKSKSEIGVVNGLAYTYYGGDVLSIEVNCFVGKGELLLTGSLGEVMKESALISLNYIKSNYKKYHIDYNQLINSDIHIHFPEGAIPKDGPSAGIAITTAIISCLTNKKIANDIAFTGEITLRGNILPIGGLKEKSMGAYRGGIKKIIIPFDNLKDLEEVPLEIREKIKYIPVKNYKEVLKLIDKDVPIKC